MPSYEAAFSVSDFQQVSAVPVLLAFQNGKPGDRIIGLQDEDKLRTFINKFIGE